MFKIIKNPKVTMYLYGGILLLFSIFLLIYFIDLFRIFLDIGYYENFPIYCVIFLLISFVFYKGYSYFLLKYKLEINEVFDQDYLKINNLFRLYYFRLFIFGLLLIFILWILTIKFFGNSALDIQFGNYYYVIAQNHIFLMFTFYYLFVFLLYVLVKTLFKVLLNNILINFHFFASIICLISFFYSTIGIAGLPRRYYAYTQINDLSEFSQIDFFKYIIFFILVQSVFILNILYSFFRKQSKK